MKNRFYSKSIFSLLFMLFFLSITNLSAQAPQKIDYQGIARNDDKSPISNQKLGVQISILKGSLQDNIVYQETHEVYTDAFGLFTFPIGTGEVQSGIFSDLAWGEDEFYINIEIDKEGGNDYVDLGSMELMSVPYALYAESSGTAEKPAHEWENTSLRFEKADGSWGEYVNLQGIQGLQGPAGKDGTGVNIIGSVSSTSNLNSNYTGDAGDMFIAEDTGAGHVWNGTAWVEVGQIQGPQGPAGTTRWDGILDIPSGFSDGIDNVEDADANETNELQDLFLSDNILHLTDGGEVDLLDYLDDQTLEINDNELSISEGNSVVLPSSPWVVNSNNDIYYPNGSVGIVTAPSPDYSLAVGGGIVAYNPGGIGFYTPGVNVGFAVGIAESIGFSLVSAGNDGIFISSVGDDGLHISNADDNGIELGTTGSDGININTAGADGIEIENCSESGIEIGSSGSSGIKVSSAEKICIP